MELKVYLKKNHIFQTLWAEKLGMSVRFFNYVVHGKRKLPQKYWTQIIVMSNGEITVEDLKNLEDFYEENYSYKCQKEAYNKDKSGNSGKLSQVQKKG